MHGMLILFYLQFFIISFLHLIKGLQADLHQIPTETSFGATNIKDEKKYTSHICSFTVIITYNI